MTRDRRTIERRKGPAKTVSLRVKVGKDDFPVTRLSELGFVITVDGRPPLRGFANIFEGDSLVRHGLVTCAWHEGDQVGYEFNHTTVAGPIAVDYAPSPI